MRIRSESCASDAIEQFTKAWIAIQLDAQRQRVDEASDQGFGLTTVTARDQRGNNDVILPRMLVEQHVKGRQHRHEHRHSFKPIQFVELIE